MVVTRCLWIWVYQAMWCILISDLLCFHLSSIWRWHLFQQIPWYVPVQTNIDDLLFYNVLSLFYGLFISWDTITKLNMAFKLTSNNYHNYYSVYLMQIKNSIKITDVIKWYCVVDVDFSHSPCFYLFSWYHKILFFKTWLVSIGINQFQWFFIFIIISMYVCKCL